MSWNEAEPLLLKPGVTFAAVARDGREHTSDKRGIAPVLELLDADDAFLQDAAVADKVVGKAAALLFVRGGVGSVYAQTISEPAAAVLRAHKVLFVCRETVPHIVNRTGDGMCPMEQCVWKIDDPKTAEVALRQRLRELRKV